MNRDTIIYCSCTFLLGLVIGSLLIGPHLKSATPDGAPASAGPVAALSTTSALQGNPMQAVFQQIASLKEKIARDPNDATALAQLGSMYMDAAKYPEAIQYFERSVAVRDDPNVRIDLGICYKQSGQMERSLAEFRKASALTPAEWQPLYNEAIVLGEMRRFDEARAIAAKLKKMRPDDPEIQKLDQALATMR